MIVSREAHIFQIKIFLEKTLQGRSKMLPNRYLYKRPNTVLEWQAPERSYPMPEVRDTPVRQQALREGFKRQADRNHNHTQQASLITGITALSNSMKL